MKKSVKKKTTPSGQALIKPNPDEEKSGCLWCPLFPFNHDFGAFKATYRRDAEKIVSKEKEPHVIRHRGVCERPWKKVRVLFVGEAPGANEDAKGLPFIGRAGDLVRLAVTEALNLKPSEYAFTNVIRCRPPRNRDPRKTEITCCSNELICEIKARQPEVIVVLGNYSLELLTGQTGITIFAGHFLKSTHPEWKDKPVLACLHPGFILRFDHHAEKFGETFGTLHEYLTGEYTPPPGPGKYKTLMKLSEVKKLLQRFKKAKKVTFDTECGSLTPFQDEFPALLCFGFSDKTGVGYTIPYDHEDSPWREGGPKEHEREALRAVLIDFFTDWNIPKIAQNEKYDRKQIYHALGCRIKGLLRDTMLTHLVLNEQRGTHGLKTLAYAYTGMGGYERPLEKYIKAHKPANPDKGGSYANIPGKLLFPYCGMDADVTYRVDDGLIEEEEYQSDPALRRLAEVFLPELSATLADIEYAGVQVDPSIVKKLDGEYTAKMSGFQKKIAKLPRVRSFVAKQIKAGKTGKKKCDPFKFNPGSVQQLRPVLFDYYDLKPVEMTDAGFKLLTSRYARIAGEQKKKVGGKVPKFQEIIDTAVANKEWQWFTTDANTLHEYERQGNDLAPLILKYREAETIYDTFIKPLLDRLDTDGRVHSSYIPHGTVTGRLSSADPNNQNIPPSAKPVYISRFGEEGVVLQADFSQIELRIAACWFNSPKMMEAYKKGIDLHAQTAADIDHITLAAFMKIAEAERKEKRTRAKRVNFGIMYGIGPPGLVGTLKKEGIHVTVEEAAALIEQYFEVRPGLKAGMEATKDDAAEHGFLRSFTGRKRRLPEVFSVHNEIKARALRQCINFPIQSGASDMTLMALVLIHRILRDEGFKSKIVLTVHDSIVFDCHVDEVLEVAKIAKDVMENLPELSDEVLPGIDWTWLKVPIVADIEMGHSWGTIVSFNPHVVAEGEESSEEMYKENEKGQTEIAREPVNIDELWEQMEFKAAKAA